MEFQYDLCGAFYLHHCYRNACHLWYLGLMEPVICIYRLLLTAVVINSSLKLSVLVCRHLPYFGLVQVWAINVIDQEATDFLSLGSGNCRTSYAHLRALCIDFHCYGIAK
jgi:hypothetical protein